MAFTCLRLGTVLPSPWLANDRCGSFFAVIVATLGLSFQLIPHARAEEIKNEKHAVLTLPKGGEERDAAPGQVTGLDKTIADVTRPIEIGNYVEAGSVVQSLKSDVQAGVGAEAIERIEHIIEDRAIENARTKFRPTAVPHPASPPSGGAFANRAGRSPVLAQKGASRRSVSDKPHELTVDQLATVNGIVAHIRTGKYREAVPHLISLRSRIRTPSHAVVEGLMAEVANLEGRHGLALELASPFAKDRARYHHDRFNCYLQLAYSHLGTQPPSPDLSLDLLNWIAENENDGDLLRQALAIEGVGQAFRLKHALDKSEDAFIFALHNVKVLQGRDAYDSLLDKADRAYLEQLNKRLNVHLADVRKKRYADRVGPIFLLYRQAQQCRIDKNQLGQAVEIYSEIIKKYPTSTFADAARLYAGLCVIDLGDWGAGEARLNEFIEASPYGLYRGEALFQLGRLSLESQLDLKKSQHYFDRLARWIEEVNTGAHAAELVEVLPGAASEITPPTSLKVRDPWGNIAYSRIESHKLLNRITADWYLTDLENSASKYLGFIRMATGNAIGAEQAFSRILDLDAFVQQQHEAGEWTDYRRLMFGATHGYLVAYPQELSQYSKRQRFLVLLADFYYVTERFDLASQLASNLLSGKYGRLSHRQLDYPNFLIGQCHLRRRQLSAAVDRYERVLALREQTWTEYRAGYALANLSQLSEDLKVRDRGRSLLSLLANSRDENEFIAAARLSMAIEMFRTGEATSAEAMLRRITARAGDQFAVAQYLLEHKGVGPVLSGQAIERSVR